MAKFPAIPWWRYPLRNLFQFYPPRRIDDFDRHFLNRHQMQRRDVILAVRTQPSSYPGRRPLPPDGDLSILSHNFGVNIVPFEVKELKNFRRQKKSYR